MNIEKSFPKKAENADSENRERADAERRMKIMREADALAKKMEASAKKAGYRQEDRADING